VTSHDSWVAYQYPLGVCSSITSCKQCDYPPGVSTIWGGEASVCPCTAAEIQTGKSGHVGNPGDEIVAPQIGRVRRLQLTSQRLKEDKDRPKYDSNAAEYGTDGVSGSHRLRNQIEQKKAHDQEDNEPLDPRHVGLLILPTSQPIRTPCRMYRQKPRCSPPLTHVR
jgi:hypothetical protein